MAARTFEVAPVAPLGADSYMNEIVVWEPEAASEIFVDRAFVEWDSGYIGEAANPADAVAGIAMAAASNASSNGDNDVPIVPVWAQPRFFANFLDDASPVTVASVLAVADMLADTQIEKATISGTVYWFVSDDLAGTDGAKMVSLQTDQHLRGSEGRAGRRADYGDTDVRVLFEVLEAIRQSGI